MEPLAQRLLASLGEAIPEAAGSVVILFHDGLEELPWTLASGSGPAQAYDDALIRSAITEDTALLEQTMLAAPIAARAGAFGACAPTPAARAATTAPTRTSCFMRRLQTSSTIHDNG